MTEKATKVTALSTEHEDGPCSTDDVMALVATVADDCRDAKESVDKRLEKMEAQTASLANAVRAIATPADEVTLAVASMDAAMADGTSTAAELRWNQCPVCKSLLTDPLHRSADMHGYKNFTCSKCQHTWSPPPG